MLATLAAAAVAAGCGSDDFANVPRPPATIELAARDEAFGERWIVPGSGPISARALAELCSEILGREARPRAAPLWLLRPIALFDADLRAFLPMAPHYARPIRYDGSKLVRLLGAPRRTSYREALAASFAWLQDRS